MTRPFSSEIYDQLVDELTLTDEHRQELQNKRGFPDNIITGGKFRSCGPSAEAVITGIRSQHGDNACLEAGIIVATGQGLQIAKPLLENRILIPFLNENQGVFFIQPHKMGLKIGVQPYFAGTGGTNSRCVLAESAYKAVASSVLGVPSVGIPGISSFAKKNYNRLVKHLRNEGVRHIIVMFDNEVKDNPEYSNYKEHAHKRWDTQYYSALMAERLEGSNFFESVKIATLPDSWRVDGKIDIDGALAAGKTSQQYADVINGALSGKNYLRSLSKETHKIVMKKMSAFFLGMEIRREDRAYWIKKTAPKTGHEYWDKISNFTMNFVAKVSVNGKTVRDLKLSSTSYQEPEVFRMEPEKMVSPAGFQEFLYGCGKGFCQFSGKSEDLAKVIQLEHARCRDEVIYEPDHVGSIDSKNDLWLFGNCAYINGRYVEAVDGVCWNGERGYKAPRYVNPNKKDDIPSDRFMPNLDFDRLDQINLKDISKRLFDNYGGAEKQGYEAIMVFCWALAAAYCNDIFKKYSCFPIMYMMGEPESGKTALGRWILSMFGIHIPGINIDKGTSVGIERPISYYSCLPVFLDECRDHSMIHGNKDSLLRSVYDRQPIPKGMRTTSNEFRSIIPRAPVIIGGEHRPSDEALNTRCLLAVFKKITPEDFKSGVIGSEYEWFQNAEKHLFPKVLPWILEYGPDKQNLLDEIEACRVALKDIEAGGPRAVQNYAVPGGVYALMIDPKDDLGFVRWLAQRCQYTKSDRIEDTIYHRFFEDLAVLENQKRIERNVHYRVDPGKLSLVFRQTYNEWLKDLADRGKNLPSSNSVKALMIKEGYCSAQKVRIGRTSRHCLVFDLTHEKCPEILHEWALGDD